MMDNKTAHLMSLLRLVCTKRRVQVGILSVFDRALAAVGEASGLVQSIKESSFSSLRAEPALKSCCGCARYPSTANLSSSRHSASRMLEQSLIPMRRASAMPTSLYETWSIYRLTTSTCGGCKPSSLGKPRINLPTTTSAADRHQGQLAKGGR